jgi:predicted phosphodiesterase
MATLYNYNAVIYGHTLNGYCTVLKNGTIYANTGSISGKNYSYDEVLINLDPELLEVLFRNIDATYKVLKSDQKTIPKVHSTKFNKLITYI